MQLRRSPVGWNALNLCREFPRDPPGALEASVKAVQVCPFGVEFHARAADPDAPAGDRQRQHVAEKLSQQP